MRFPAARVGAVALLAVLLVSATGGIAVAAPTALDTSPANVTGPTQTSTSRTAAPAADGGMVININVTGDGDANWTVASRFVLNGTNETAEFRDLAAAVASGTSDIGYSTRTFERFASLAENATGRSMEIRGGTWTSRVHNGTGVLAFHFTWTNFAATNGDRITVGDAFERPSGTWFPTLTANQRLVINAPPNYAVVSATRPPDNGTVRWTGPYRFDRNEIRVTYRYSPGSNGGTTTTTNPPDQREEGFPWLLLVVGTGILVVLVGAGGYLLAHRQTREERSEEGANRPSPEARRQEPTDASREGTPQEGGDATAEETTAGASTEPTEPSTTGGAADGGTDATESDIDEELLSDEERVERLLERNGGRMKQGDIVDETGWSNAKVSQLLSSMDENDRINKLRIGRENLIALPDEEIGQFD